MISLAHALSERSKGLLISISRPRSSSGSTFTATTLLASFNDPEISNYLVVYFRLLTSAYLRANVEDFFPFLFSWAKPSFFSTRCH
jgi:hypothetical protein